MKTRINVCIFFYTVLVVVVVLGKFGRKELLTQDSSTAGIRISLSKRRATTKRLSRFTISNNRTHSGPLPIPLKDFENSEYIGKLGIGTPFQQLSVIFDTGSSDLWIPGEQCVACLKHKKFISSISRTYSPKYDASGKRSLFDIYYGSGSVHGAIAKDVVRIGSFDLKNATFGEALVEDSNIAEFDMDGICGLAFSSLARMTKPTVMELLAASYPNIPNVFSIYLSSNPDKTSDPSLLIFGGYDLSLVGQNASWLYTPVVRMGRDLMYWTVSLKSFSVTPLTSFDRSYKNIIITASFCSSTNPCFAMVDSGTSGIAVPSQVYSQLVAAVTKGHTCKDLVCVGQPVSSFPVLLITLEPDNVFPLLPSDYVECTPWEQCFVRFQQSATDVWILGDAFMQAYYTLFDAQNLRLGFACQGQCAGGNWHGIGGFALVKESPWWLRGGVIMLMFVLLTAMLYLGLEQARDGWVNTEGVTNAEIRKRLIEEEFPDRQPLLAKHLSIAPTSYLLNSNEETRINYERESVAVMVHATAIDENYMLDSRLPSASATIPSNSRNNNTSTSSMVESRHSDRISPSQQMPSRQVVI